MRRVVLTALLALATLPTASAHAQTICPNEALREAQGTTGLPACMALEMVSPPKKFSLPAYGPWFSLDGERVAYLSPAALGDTSGLQRFAGDYYVAARGGSGWQTFATSPPAAMAIIVGGPRRGGPYAFAPDLGSWLALAARHEQAQVGVGRIYNAALDGSFLPFSPLLVTNDDSGTDLAVSMVNLELHGVSAELSRAVVQMSGSRSIFLPGDPRGNLVPNSYIVSNSGGTPSLELLARSDEDGTVYGGRCGARLGGGTDPGRVISQGAISDDSQTIFFTTRPAQDFDEENPEEAPVCDLDNPLRIMKRVGEPGEAEISPIAPALPAGEDIFQGASADGTKAYFTTARQVTAADKDMGAKCSNDLGSSSGCDLYLYDSTKPEGERISLVSAGEGPTPGEGADVLSSIGALSGDGTHAYFVAEGVLSTDANPEGDTAVDGEPNLYLYESDTEQTSFIATLAASDQESMWGSEGSFIGDAYAVPFHGPGNGHVLVFASAAPLTVGDEDTGHTDLFRYDAEAETLIRVSAATEGDDEGPFGVTLNANSANARGANLEEIGRFASEDGETIAFATAAALLPSDEDATADPYVWKEGELSFVDATTGADDIPTVSTSGEEVAIATSSQLLPQDGDVIRDVYAIRAGGGFASVQEPARCDPLSEGSCQGQAPAAPVLPGAASVSFSGPGNQAQPTRCRKGQIKRRGRCVRRQAKRRGAKHKRSAKRRGTNR